MYKISRVRNMVRDTITDLRVLSALETGTPRLLGEPLICYRFELL